MSIPNHAEHVDKEHAAASNTNPASTESDDQSDTSNSSLQTPVQRLKATISFRALMETDGQQLKKTGTRWICRCPFHADRTPSFVVDEADDRATCYGCDWYGDIFNYVMSRTGCNFGTAFHHLAQASTLHDTKTKASPRIPKTSEYKFTEPELKEIEKSTLRILNDEECCNRIAHARNWKPETIRLLAEGRHLGWGGDALNFIYKTGIKVRRWPGKEFRWWAGEPYIWRADLLGKASTVYLTEGEPDAITLIDIGCENQPLSVVVAAPSASTFNPSWAKMFAGKGVTICFDADEAGEKGVSRIGPLIEAVAKSVEVWTPKEVA